MPKIRFHASIMVSESTEEGKADELFREEQWKGYDVRQSRSITVGSASWTDHNVPLFEDVTKPIAFMLFDAEKPVNLAINNTTSAVRMTNALFFAGFVSLTADIDCPAFCNYDADTDQYVKSVVVSVGGNPT